jgi:hypothetical protein
MRRILLLFCLLAGTACAGKGPIGPTVPLDEQFTLAPGEVASIRDTALQVQFVDVTGDSRCPADVVCIQGGDALVHVRAFGDGATARYELHTGNASEAVVTHGPYRIALTDLQPYPFSSRAIRDEEYRATLRVTRP